MNKKLFLLNVLSVLLVLFVNYYSQTGRINGKTIGSLSNEYANLFTPASFTFSIWGLIFLGLIGFICFQGASLLKTSNLSSYFEHLGLFFALVNLGNALWVIVWLYEQTLISVLVMTGMLVGLIILLNRVSNFIGDLSSIPRFFIVGPIAIYAGWITVATIANFSAYLSKIGWDGGFISEDLWTAMMIVVAVLINIYVTRKRSINSFSLVGAWALYGIYYRHASSYQLIALTALSGLGVLLLSILIRTLKTRRAFLK